MMTQLTGAEIYTELIDLYKDKAEKEEALGKVGKEIGTDTVVYDVVKKSLEETNAKIKAKLDMPYAVYIPLTFKDQAMKESTIYRGGKL